MNNKTKIPKKPGFYWWRAFHSDEWEPVKITINRDGNLLCKWIGSSSNTYIDAVGGYWHGELEVSNGK